MDGGEARRRIQEGGARRALLLDARAYGPRAGGPGAGTWTWVVAALAGGLLVGGLAGRRGRGGAAAGGNLMDEFRAQAEYHKGKVAHHRKQIEFHQKQVQYHAGAFQKASTAGGDAPRTVLDDQAVCVEELVAHQPEYFVTAGQVFHIGQNQVKHNLATMRAINAATKAVKAKRGGVERCVYLDIGSGHTPDVFKKYVKTVGTTCSTYAYDDRSELVKPLQGASHSAGHRGAGAPVVARLKAFGEQRMSFTGGGTPLTTLDLELAEVLGTHFGAADVVVVRFGRAVRGGVWADAPTGKGAAKGAFRASSETLMQALRGMEGSLLTQKVSLVTWERFSDMSMLEEVRFLEQFGYQVFVQGVDRFLRVDRQYFDPIYGGSGNSTTVGKGTGIAALAQCKMRLQLMAFPEGHPVLAEIYAKQLPCTPNRRKGVCVCRSAGGKGRGPELYGRCRGMDRDAAVDELAKEGGGGGAFQTVLSDVPKAAAEPGIFGTKK